MTLIVAQNERGIVRVFALSMTETDAQALSKDHAAQATKLGLEKINASFVEVFPIADLDELGLPGYLVEGNGIDSASLEPDRVKLTALAGWVLIAYSSAFDDSGVTLAPTSDLTHIGTYSEPGVDWSSDAPLVTKSASGTAAPASKKTPSDAAMSGRIAMLALLVLFAVTALMIWVAS